MDITTNFIPQNGSLGGGGKRIGGGWGTHWNDNGEEKKNAIKRQNSWSLVGKIDGASFKNKTEIKVPPNRKQQQRGRKKMGLGAVSKVIGTKSAKSKL